MLDVVNKLSTHGGIGSFWYETISREDLPKVNTLLSLPEIMSCHDLLEEKLQSLSGNTISKCFNITLNIDFNQIRFLSIKNINSNDFDSHFVNHNSVKDIIYFPALWFTIPIDKNFYPLSVDSSMGVLLNGIDFYIRNNLLIFKVNPRELFPDNKFTILSGVKKTNSIFNHFLKFDDGASSSINQMNVVRMGNTVSNLKRALAEIFNLDVLQNDSKLLAKNYHEGNIEYIFEDQTINCFYPHKELIVGRVYKKDTIIGDAIEILHDTGNRDKWFPNEIDNDVFRVLIPNTTKDGFFILDNKEIKFKVRTHEKENKYNSLHVEKGRNKKIKNVRNYFNTVKVSGVLVINSQSDNAKMIVTKNILEPINYTKIPRYENITNNEALSVKRNMYSGPAIVTERDTMVAGKVLVEDNFKITHKLSIYKPVKDFEPSGTIEKLTVARGERKHIDGTNNLSGSVIIYKGGSLKIEGTTAISYGKKYYLELDKTDSVHKTIGDTEQQDRFFWNQILNKNEFKNNIYLNEIVKLKSFNDVPKAGNMFFLMFELFLKYRGIIFILDKAAIKDSKKAIDYIIENVPCGKLPVFCIYDSNVLKSSTNNYFSIDSNNKNILIKEQL